MINNPCRVVVLEDCHHHQVAEGQAAEGRHHHQAAEDQPLPAPAVGHQEQEALEDVATGAGEAVQLQVHP